MKITNRSFDERILRKKSLGQLQSIARIKGVVNYESLSKKELVRRVKDY